MPREWKANKAPSFIRFCQVYFQRAVFRRFIGGQGTFREAVYLHGYVVPVPFTQADLERASLCIGLHENCHIGVVITLFTEGPAENFPEVVEDSAAVFGYDQRRMTVGIRYLTRGVSGILHVLAVLICKFICSDVALRLPPDVPAEVDFLP